MKKTIKKAVQKESPLAATIIKKLQEENSELRTELSAEARSAEYHKGRYEETQKIVQQLRQDESTRRDRFEFKRQELERQRNRDREELTFLRLQILLITTPADKSEAVTKALTNLMDLIEKPLVLRFDERG